MNLSARLGRAAIAAFILGCTSVGAGSAFAAETTTVAQGTATLQDKVTDEAGALSAEEKSQLEQKITQLQKDEHLTLFVYITDELGTDPESFAGQAVKDKGPNSAVYALSIKDRKMGVQTGKDWPKGRLDQMYDAAYDKLASDEYGASAVALADAALGNSASNSSASDSSGLAWLGGGAAAIVAAGGGIMYYSRRNTKKNNAQTLESAREIAPGDTDQLGRLPLETLDQLAQEELVSTDESIRRGKEELNIALSEFGPERVRPFTKAMNHSTSTLQKAFHLRQRLDDAVPESSAERRQMLVEIVSSCGQADDALDAQSEEFAKMRDLLIHSDEKLDELTQRTVGLRTRLPEAESTLAGLKSNYDEHVLSSIADNPELAAASLDEAEKLLDKARGVQAQPAGQQGPLVGLIRDIEHACEMTDRLISGVENAEENIATARGNLEALIAEVEGEINEARELERQGKAQGTTADWDALEDLLGRAGTAVNEAKAHGQQDPLGQHTALTSIDTELDEALDRVREKTSTHARQLDLFRQQISVAESNIQAAEDLISSRGRIIGSGARTALADAKRLHAQALHTERSDIRAALQSSREAVAAAQAALQRAKEDIDEHRRRQQRQQMGNAAGNVVTGMVLGQMLSGGRGFGGGFGGGGFGGGSFGGGDFGGGGGGGFRGGSF
ncbi:TPM domain-containing protein [Corynebacterium tuberculostearicum]|uniref:TPM domain-containing protein n=1 Tax=Corynebacterium tuberculostearicum TaxID=38304 RepID=UPI00264AC1BA|nr:TPM domain-containing protein [Corynebacterium tuberculostearicum]MDN8595757.1 TPM domain-containing protein [Corynebacterium tuberculostearicum]